MSVGQRPKYFGKQTLQVGEYTSHIDKLVIAKQLAVVALQ